MKYFTLTTVTLSLLLYLNSCNSTAPSEDKCFIQTVELECNKAGAYNTMIELNEIINSTFNEGAQSLSLEEELKLREDFVSYYSENKEIINQTYRELKDSLPTLFEPKRIYKMRLGEVDYFKNQMGKQEETKELIKKLDIRTYETDTILPGHEEYEPEHSLVLKIKNTLKKPISGIRINQNYIVEGELQKADNPTYFILTANQIIPKPEGAAIVASGATLTLLFDTSQKKIAKPEIIEIITAEVE